jgi:hypothetical protein
MPNEFLAAKNTINKPIGLHRSYKFPKSVRNRSTRNISIQVTDNEESSFNCYRASNWISTDQISCITTGEVMETKLMSRNSFAQFIKSEDTEK